MEIVTLTTVPTVVDRAGILKEDQAKCVLSRAKVITVLTITTLRAWTGPSEARESKLLNNPSILNTMRTSSLVLEPTEKMEV